MSITSKSPRRIAMMALEVAKGQIPLYAHRYSPKKYTQHQLFACLVLKRQFKLDYRGVWALLLDMPTLCDDLGLKQVPHYTTLQKASARLLDLPNTKKLLNSTNEHINTKDIKKNDT